MTSPFSYFIVIYAGKNADTEIAEAFLKFSNDMGEDFNRQQQFPNIQYSTLISIVMRSFETLIENHVGANFKPKTLRYLFTRLSDTTEFPNHPFRTDVKRDLAERVYNAICTNQEIIYPANLEVADIHKVSINNLIDECRQRLHGLNLTEADYYAKPHLYLPWLYHTAEKYQEGNPDIQQANQQKWKPLAPRDNAGEAERSTVVAFGGLRGNVPSPTRAFRKALLNYVKSTRRNQPKFKKVRRYD
ncbi:uncharacterized protein BX663DRAFT_549382 [Cokeromyces recurvatus]|uniref:uncharacterized protein n=1 Tax=Cokeromyces recurvatus TaxID=90255 RepID=UPI00221EE4B9|nr:uncharacterized protein BX663DRAFT_549382 [Cokeromyces recurvatus]KAI7905373.1 hypothetical protein BX663DRAFT_549382 [Cokeromyces recurvatus]